ncbi:hypothetical protein A0U90_00690 [Kozakia baliensis]|nr:hypothetical protein A0U90_00690 [Kozakia baliensis]
MLWGRRMMLWHRFLFVFLLVIPLSVAQAADCRDQVLDGQYPALMRQDLATRTTLLCNLSFVEMASGVTHEPLWSAEHLTRQSVRAARHQVRQGIFHEDTRLPFADRSTLADYRRSGFDRGHMTPSGDAPTEVAQQQTFSLSNMVPQTPDLNRGLWAGVEKVVRDLATQNGEVYVVTGPAYRTEQVVTIGADKLFVPTSTWKAVYVPSARGTGVYVCKNVTTPSCDRVPVATLTRVVGIDPFPSLPADVKARLMPLPAPEPEHYHVSPRLRRQTLNVLGQFLKNWRGLFGTE